jgi:molecular chaperone GrpE (heat shock protein)
MGEELEHNGNQVDEAAEPGVAAHGEASVDAETDAAEHDASSAPKVVDKRRFARLLGFGFGAGGQASDLESEATRERLPSYVDELRDRAERAQAEARAETDAAKARLERHYEGRLAAARAEVIATILPVLDNLELALAVPDAEASVLYDGVVATRDQFVKQLAELGAEPVAGEGAPFDPEVHEAVDTVPVDNAASDGRITDVLRRGFKVGERLVRPSIVRVGRFVESSSNPNSG